MSSIFSSGLTIVGPPVPEMDLDSRYGVTLAGDPIIDGDMEAGGVTAWVPQGAQLAMTKQSGQRPGGSGSQVLRGTLTVPGSYYCRQVPHIIGRRYRTTGWARGDGVSTRPRLLTGAGYWEGSTSATWQNFDIEYTADHSFIFMYTSGVATGWAEWDDIAIQQYQITTWADQASSNNGSQGAAAWQPTYIVSGINGLPSVQFHGSNNRLIIAQFMYGSSEAEVFLVGKLDNDPPASLSKAGVWYFGMDISSYSELPGTDGVIRDRFGSTVLHDTGYNTGGTLASPFLYNVSTRSGDWTARLNGTQIYSTPTNVVGWSGAHFLGSSFGLSNYFDGLMSRVLIYSPVLSVDQRAKVVAGLKSIYGIA
jgi:hypothetical protein